VLSGAGSPEGLEKARFVVGADGRRCTEPTLVPCGVPRRLQTASSPRRAVFVAGLGDGEMMLAHVNVLRPPSTSMRPSSSCENVR